MDEEEEYYSSTTDDDSDSCVSDSENGTYEDDHGEELRKKMFFSYKCWKRC